MKVLQERRRKKKKKKGRKCWEGIVMWRREEKSKTAIERGK
jgi:hypothetical protein